MTRRIFGWLLPLLPAALLGKSAGETITLTGLDPRFVEQQRVAARSRELTLEQWMVHAALMESGYTLNNGFVK